jgi:hypothetical protein
MIRSLTGSTLFRSVEAVRKDQAPERFISMGWNVGQRPVALATTMSERPQVRAPTSWRTCQEATRLGGDLARRLSRRQAEDAFVQALPVRCDCALSSA